MRFFLVLQLLICQNISARGLSLEYVIEHVTIGFVIGILNQVILQARSSNLQLIVLLVFGALD